MERKNLGLYSAFLVAGAAAIAVPNLAEAQRTPVMPAPLENPPVVELTPDNPPDQFVEWLGCGPDGLVRCVIGDTRRKLIVTTTPNAPFSASFGCPPSSSYGDWTVAVPSGGVAPGSDSAEVHDMAVERTGANGVFQLQATAPARTRQRVKTKVSCARRDGGDNEDLELEVETVTPAELAGQTAGGSGAFSYEDRTGASGGSSGGINGVLVEGSVGLLGTFPTDDLGLGAKPGVSAEVSAYPVYEEGLRRFGAGVQYRFAGVKERVALGQENTEVAVSGKTHCGFMDFSWVPGIIKNVRARIAAALGVCHAEQLQTQDGVIPGLTGVTAKGEAALEVGGDNFGVRVGGDAAFGANSPFNFAGVGAWIYGRF